MEATSVEVKFLSDTEPQNNHIFSKIHRMRPFVGSEKPIIEAICACHIKQFEIEHYVLRVDEKTQNERYLLSYCHSLTKAEFVSA